MLEVLSALVTRVLEPGAETEVGDEDDEDEEEDVIMDIGVGDSVVERAIALLNDKECVAFLVKVAETSIQQTNPTFSGQNNSHVTWKMCMTYVTILVLLICQVQKNPLSVPCVIESALVIIVLTFQISIFFFK